MSERHLFGIQSPNLHSNDPAGRVSIRVGSQDELGHISRDLVRLMMYRESGYASRTPTEGAVGSASMTNETIRSLPNCAHVPDSDGGRTRTHA